MRGVERAHELAGVEISKLLQSGGINAFAIEMSEIEILCEEFSELSAPSVGRGSGDILLEHRRDIPFNTAAVTLPYAGLIVHRQTGIIVSAVGMASGIGTVEISTAFLLQSQLSINFVIVIVCGGVDSGI